MDKMGQNRTRMDKMIKGKIPCAHKQCSNYSESGCELWNECPVFQADNVTPKPASRSWRNVVQMTDEELAAAQADLLLVDVEEV